MYFWFSQQLIFNVDNGEGDMEVTDKTDLTDGQWHHVYASKIKNVIVLILDSGTSNYESGKGERSVDSDGPLYIGGVPSKSAHLLPQ